MPIRPTRVPSMVPILRWNIGRQFHWCFCTAPVTLLAENKKEGREGETTSELCLKKSYHTFTADVTNANFHVSEDEECHVDPAAEWLEQQAALENPTSVLWRLRKQMYGWRPAGTRWVDFMAERFAEQSFDKCDASPQILANYELDVSIEVHMDELHGMTKTCGGPGSNQPLTENPIQNLDSVRSGNEITNTSSVSECCTMTRLRSHPTHNT